MVWILNTIFDSLQACNGVTIIMKQVLGECVLRSSLCEYHKDRLLTPRSVALGLGLIMGIKLDKALFRVKIMYQDHDQKCRRLQQIDLSSG